MGTLEEKSKRRARKNELKKIILETVKIAGLIGIFVVAPNVVGAMAKVGLIRSRRQREIIERSRDRMVQQGLLRREGKYLRLTTKGETVLRNLSLRDYQLSKPPRWDRKWRVIIFDIPEYRKGLRQKVRSTLMKIGFARLQDSVWVYPYDCEDLVTLLKADFKVGKDILYLIVDTVENDRALRKYFELP